ncbi:MAG TPA: outer membrane beta-barrel protein [Candidatus Eremiobacteraceae bacterium]|nr:outer membrane beta-barrel protein [Candidatus Eremiobacteraceae bacterium]
MREFPSTLPASVAVTKRLLLCALVFCVPVMAQDITVNRYTIYSGFDYMVSPARNLTERGFDVDFGLTIKPWFALGGDVSAIGNSIISGAGTINGTETVYARPVSAVGIPPNQIHVPFRSTTYTFAVGPQFYLRKWRAVTFLVRPGLGGIHESADLTLPPELGPLFTELGIPIPSSHQKDTTWFVGLGGGFDVNMSRRVALRFTADWVNTHLFSDLLTDRQNYVRFTVGPTFRWGRL